MNSKKRILLVEDDESLGATIAENLQLDGFDLKWVRDGKDGLSALDGRSFDLILLDRMLPQVQGLEVLRQIRRTSSVPIMMISAKSSAQDRIQGLEELADDYLAKPFHFKELRLRIDSLLRRCAVQESSEHETLALGEVVFDFTSHEVRHPTGVNEKLTQKEVLFLLALKRANGAVVKRDDLVSTLWKNDVNANTRTIDNLMVKFRKWVSDDPNQPRHFVSHRGIGYSLRRNI